jgi:hypothetical protein
LWDEWHDRATNEILTKLPGVVGAGEREFLRANREVASAITNGGTPTKRTLVCRDRFDRTEEIVAEAKRIIDARLTPRFDTEE